MRVASTTAKTASTFHSTPNVTKEWLAHLHSELARDKKQAKDLMMGVEMLLPRARDR
jgi:hypothetical protein